MPSERPPLPILFGLTFVKRNKEALKVKAREYYARYVMVSIVFCLKQCLTSFVLTGKRPKKRRTRESFA